MTSRIYAAFLCAALIAWFAGAGHAAAKENRPSQTAVARKGTLPESGRIVIRSGLSWLDETTPVFVTAQRELAPLLAKRGLIVVPVSASTLAPMPRTALPPDGDALAVPGVPQPSGEQAAGAQRKAAELAREGKLPQLVLRHYAAPQQDADLPKSVRGIVPPDVDTALFALSQRKGVPVLRRGVTIPGRLPEELRTSDPKIADYALLLRFAVMQPLGVGGLVKPLRAPVAQREILLAAAGGTGALGFGSPAPPPPSRNNYGTPGGYARGYEGFSPNDFWGRDSDFFSRDYQLRNSPSPPAATPPSNFSTLPGMPAQAMPRGAYRSGSSAPGWYLLEMACYDLAPAREGKTLRIVWQISAEQAETPEGLAVSLPRMIQAVFAESGQ